MSFTIAVDGVVVEWSLVPTADSYNLYRSETSGFTPSSSTLLAAKATTPYYDKSVEEGKTYYYVVTALKGTKMSAPSPQGGAKFAHTDPSVIPQNVTVIATPETPNSLTVQWDEVPGATSYNLYWSTSPGVTALTGTKIAGVLSPDIETGLTGGTSYYYVVTAVIGGIERPESAEVSAAPRGSRNPGSGGGGEEETLGNNLSVPLVFADGYGITGTRLAGTVPPEKDYATGLRPLSTETPASFPYFDAATAYSKSSTLYYPQGTPSTWQAAWLNGAFEPQHVTIDWGDQLRSRTASANSTVRIEATLYQELTDPAAFMTAYKMTSLYGTQRTEKFGADGTTYASSRRTVFAMNARLKIEKLMGPGGEVDTSVPPIVDKAVYQGFGSTDEGEGQDTQKFGIEVNGSGSAIYGYTWILRNSAIPAGKAPGWWRVTFSLDDAATVGTTSVPNNTFIDAVDAADTTAKVVSPTASTIEFQVQ